MDRFVAHYTTRLDAKGRVSIPAAYRLLLDKEGYDGLFLCPAMGEPAFDCGGHALLDEIDTLLNSFPAYSEERDLLSTALLGRSQILKRDPEGRFIITDFIRALTGISDSVTFVGHGNKFQLWEPTRFEAHSATAVQRLPDLRRRLSPPAPRS
jgi:MraZ protein